MNKLLTFQKIISILFKFWKKIGCITLYAFDLEIGAATSHLYTFFKSINPNPWYCIYLQPCRRPQDNIYIKNSNKLQKYYQLQVILKPVPKNILNIYINSLKKFKLNFKDNNIKFIENNWENPSLGALGVGWEIWLNEIEICQFTYFHKMGGILCKPIIVEITYGLERLAMILQKKKNIHNIIWEKMFIKNYKYITYKDIHLFNEISNSIYISSDYNVIFLFNIFNLIELEIKKLIKLKLIIISYELTIKLCYLFNCLDSINILSYNEKLNYIKRIRVLSCLIANLYFLKFKKKKF